MHSRRRFPGEIISYCVWPYHTFPLSYRDIEKMMLYRGIEVSYETIREWGQKFGHSEGLRYAIEKFPSTLQTQLKQYRQQQLKLINANKQL
jgi:transposase-like protein